MQFLLRRMKEIILGIWLGLQSYLDFKYKEIPVWLSIVGAVFGIIFCLLEKRQVLPVLLSLLPGICALLFSWITKEIMGYGDGVVLFVLGIYMPLKQLLSTGMLAFGLAGLVALVLLVVFRKNGRYRIPFVPFLGIAFIMEKLIVIGEI